MDMVLKGCILFLSVGIGKSQQENTTGKKTVQWNCFLILKERKDKDFLNAALKEICAAADAQEITTMTRKSGMRPIQSTIILGLMVANTDHKYLPKIV